MPNYRVRCEECDLEENHFAVIDDRHSIEMSCGHIGRIMIVPGDQSYIRFREGWYEHITSEPLYIRSRQELAMKCREHNVYSKYLLDSPIGGNPEKREI